MILPSVLCERSWRDLAPQFLSEHKNLGICCTATGDPNGPPLRPLDVNHAWALIWISLYSQLPWLWSHRCCSSSTNVNRIYPTSLWKACNGSNAKGMWITRGYHTRQIITTPTQPHQLARKITRFTQINENQLTVTEYELCKKDESAKQQRKQATRRRWEQVLFTSCNKNSNVTSRLQFNTHSIVGTLVSIRTVAILMCHSRIAMLRG